ncbi:uncharacterized protein LOC114704215 isoform X2 [Peromyscus leucopus]|uniref:uncharacterized protein LOC114704215 isoform X2 n=1 Tax=Peromyscus leucopus TaxID=10041 RepID=UPI0010A1D242|nr:uncharacterized protein LOC114704215 isoform X2 [Peromyscus leucopus]
MAASARGRGAGEQLAVGRLLRRGWEWLPGPESKRRRSARVGRGGRRRGSPFVCALPKWLRPGRAGGGGSAVLPRPGRPAARSRSPGTKALSGRLEVCAGRRGLEVCSSDLWPWAEKQIPDGKAPCWNLAATSQGHRHF